MREWYTMPYLRGDNPQPMLQFKHEDWSYGNPRRGVLVSDLLEADGPYQDHANGWIAVECQRGTLATRV